MKQLFFTLITLAIWSHSYAQDELLMKRSGTFDVFEISIDSVNSMVDLASLREESQKTVSIDSFRITFDPEIFSIDYKIPVEGIKTLCCWSCGTKRFWPDTTFNKYTHPENIQMILDNYLKNPTQAWSAEYQKLEHKLEVSQTENLWLKLYIGLGFLFNLLLGVWVVRRFYQQRHIKTKMPH